MSKPINWIKLPSRRTARTTENNVQEMAACLFWRKRRSKGHEQELREENYCIWRTDISPSSVNRSVLLSSEKPFTILLKLFTYKNISRRVN